MLKIEDLKCFEFQNGESDWVIARNKEEAIKYYQSLIGDEIYEYEITEIENWQDIKMKKEITGGWKDITFGWKDMTFLEDVKETFLNKQYFKPYMIATTIKI